MTAPRAVMLALLLAVATPASADEAFDANLAIARQNLATPAGAGYDRALGDAIGKLPAVGEAIETCRLKHPGDHALQGYFHFTSPNRYTVAMAPAGAIATCVGRALEGHALPAPPALPWLNHFTLSLQATATGNTP